MSLSNSKNDSTKSSDYSNEVKKYDQKVEVQSNANHYNEHFTKSAYISSLSKKRISIIINLKEIENKKKHLKFNLSNR